RSRHPRTSGPWFQSGRRPAVRVRTHPGSEAVVHRDLVEPVVPDATAIVREVELTRGASVDDRSDVPVRRVVPELGTVVGVVDVGGGPIAVMGRQRMLPDLVVVIALEPGQLPRVSGPVVEAQPALGTTGSGPS